MITFLATFGTVYCATLAGSARVEKKYNEMMQWLSASALFFIILNVDLWR
jgi:ABC-type nitrate/sulfonate/bicarbonate transport system permease component